MAYTSLNVMSDNALWISILLYPIFSMISEMDGGVGCFQLTEGLVRRSGDILLASCVSLSV